GAAAQDRRAGLLDPSRHREQAIVAFDRARPGHDDDFGAADAPAADVDEARLRAVLAARLLVGHRVRRGLEDAVHLLDVARREKRRIADHTDDDTVVGRGAAESEAQLHEQRFDALDLRPRRLRPEVDPHVAPYSPRRSTRPPAAPSPPSSPGPRPPTPP